MRTVAHPRVGEEDHVTRDTILVMNAGAHVCSWSNYLITGAFLTAFQWSRAELAMLPNRQTDVEEQARVVSVHRQIVRFAAA